MSKIREFFQYLKWINMGKPMIFYPGFHCGCCGKWNAIPFGVPYYKSSEEWWDTWGICPDKHCDEDDEDSEGQRMIDREIANY